MNVHSWTGMYDSSAPALEYSTGFRPFCALTISPFTFRRKNREPPGYAMSYILLILNLRERDKSIIFDRRRKRKNKVIRSCLRRKSRINLVDYIKTRSIFMCICKLAVLLGPPSDPPSYSRPCPSRTSEASSSIDCRQTRPAHLREL